MKQSIAAADASMDRRRHARWPEFMPMKGGATLQVLREIRDEVRGTNMRLERVDARVGRVEERVDAVEAAVTWLDRRLVESEVRVASEVLALAGVVGEVRDLLRENLGVRSRVDDHERRISLLERRFD